MRGTLPPFSYTPVCSVSYSYGKLSLDLYKCITFKPSEMCKTIVKFWLRAEPGKNYVAATSNKVFLSNQPRQMYKWNRYHIPVDEDRDGPRNVGFFYISGADDCLRRLYWILSPREFQIIAVASPASLIHIFVVYLVHTHNCGGRP
jgi:hypothetical protein